MKFLYTFLLILPIFCSAEKNSQGIDPLYTGPLLTPSADNIDPGSFFVQPYIFVTDSHRHYTSSWHKQSGPKVFSVIADSTIQFGLNRFLDVTFDINGIYQKKGSYHATRLGDVYIEFGFQLLKDKKGTPKPSIRFVVRETFPTGDYKKLSPNKNWTDASGSGSYATSLAINFSKTVYWMENHPIRFRLATNYSFPTKVSVKGFNSYGGGYNSQGKVSPGNIFQAYFSFEYSITRKWVLASDFVYHRSSKSTFSGHNGTNKDGTIATNNTPETEQITIAPALEYNFNKNVGIIAGAWFSVAGKNSNDFISYVVSLAIGY